MKKLIAMLTVLAMLAAFAVPAFATTTTITAPDDNVVLDKDTNGFAQIDDIEGTLKYEADRDRTVLDQFYEDWKDATPDDSTFDDIRENDVDEVVKSIQVEKARAEVEGTDEIDPDPDEDVVVFGEVVFDYVISIPAGAQDLGTLDVGAYGSIGQIELISANLPEDQYLTVEITYGKLTGPVATAGTDEFEYTLTVDSSVVASGDTVEKFHQSAILGNYGVGEPLDVVLAVTTALTTQSAGYYYDTITFTITPVIDDGTDCDHVDDDDDGVCDICSETL